MNNLYPHFSFSFKRTAYQQARLGKIITPHGLVDTPNFIFCGTKASLKGMPTHYLARYNIKIILANTYHLMLSPGADLIKKMGGLHRFMNYQGVMFTDSGGYQIFAMGYGSVSQEIKKKNNKKNKSLLLKITKEGAWFKSYLDGSKHFLTPEKSIVIQKKLGADLIVQLDECSPYDVEKEYTIKSMEMSLHWGKRSLKEFKKNNDYQQALYRVIHGGVYQDLRKRSVIESSQENFFGTAVGGSLGKSKEQMHEVIGYTMSELKGYSGPIHLLGIGEISDIFWGIQNGIDTFDCVRPTRIARHGSIIAPQSLYPSGVINLNNSQYRDDCSPLAFFNFFSSPNSSNAYTKEDWELSFENYSKGYLHYLLRAKEIAVIEILTIFNVVQVNKLFSSIRQALKENYFLELKKFWCG